MNRHSARAVLTTLSALYLFSACKRDMVSTTAASNTEARALTLQTNQFNFLSGNPHHFPPDVAESFTTAGGVGTTIFKTPVSVASCGDGFLWVADSANNQVLIVSAINGLVFSTIGTGVAGFQDGSFATAQFNHPNGIALGPDGTLYVADMGNNCIRAINLFNGSSPVSTFAGSRVAGFNDGTPLVAKFNQPTGVAVDINGTVYVADQGNNMIRRIINKNSVTRWAGQLAPGSTDANGSLASFNAPRGIALSPTGALYVADMGNNKIRKITSGNVTTFAGGGKAGLQDATGVAAGFSSPAGVATDSLGNVYVADRNNAAIRMITPAGVVVTIAGGERGTFDGIGLNARYRTPIGIMVGPRGNIFIADPLEPAIREIQFIPAVQTLAGNGQLGYQEGMGKGAIFSNPQSVAVGPDGSIYAFDNYDFTAFSVRAGKSPKIRKITPDGTTSLLAGGNTTGFNDGPATQAAFGGDCTLAVGPDGTVYVADKENNRIRKISGGMVTTLAGNGEAGDFDGTGANAGIGGPSAIAVDATGNIYACTVSTGRLDKITPAGVLTCVHRFGLDQPGPQAGQKIFPSISGLTIDAQGHKFVVAPETVYEVIADNQPEIVYFGGFTANGGLNVGSFFPTAIAIDKATGNLYLGSENINNISLLTPSKQLSVVAGSIGGNPGFLDGFVSQTLFNGVTGVALGANGILYIADTENNRIRMMRKQ